MATAAFPAWPSSSMAPPMAAPVFDTRSLAPTVPVAPVQAPPAPVCGFKRKADAPMVFAGAEWPSPAVTSTPWLAPRHPVPASRGSGTVFAPGAGAGAGSGAGAGCGGGRTGVPAAGFRSKRRRTVGAFHPTPRRTRAQRRPSPAHPARARGRVRPRSPEPVPELAMGGERPRLHFLNEPRAQSATSFAAPACLSPDSGDAVAFACGGSAAKRARTKDYTPSMEPAAGWGAAAGSTSPTPEPAVMDDSFALITTPRSLGGPTPRGPLRVIVAPDAEDLLARRTRLPLRLGDATTPLPAGTGAMVCYDDGTPVPAEGPAAPFCSFDQGGVRVWGYDAPQALPTGAPGAGSSAWTSSVVVEEVDDDETSEAIDAAAHLLPAVAEAGRRSPHVDAVPRTAPLIEVVSTTPTHSPFWCEDSAGVAAGPDTATAEADSDVDEFGLSLDLDEDGDVTMD